MMAAARAVRAASQRLGKLPPLTVDEVVRVILEDRNGGYCRYVPKNVLVEPREVWFSGGAMWVRTDGHNVSAALRGHLRPGPLGRWRIRCAFRNRHYPIRGLL